MQAGTNIGENDRKHCAGSTKRVETPELPPYRDQAKLLSKKKKLQLPPNRDGSNPKLN